MKSTSFSWPVAKRSSRPANPYLLTEFTKIGIWSQNSEVHMPCPLPYLLELVTSLIQMPPCSSFLLIPSAMIISHNHTVRTQTSTFVVEREKIHQQQDLTQRSSFKFECNHSELDKNIVIGERLERKEVSVWVLGCISSKSSHWKLV